MEAREIATNRLSRRRFLYGAAALAAAACAPAASPSPSASGPVVLKGTKVQLLHWTSFVPDEDKWFKETLVNDWAKPNGVDLTVELVSANEAQPKIVAALQAGGGPDVMLLQWTWSHLYADKLADVSDIAEKVGSDGGGFYDAMKQNAQVQGTWRAVPFGMLGNAIHYRDSLLKDAGATKFPETWSELTKVGADVKAKSKLFLGQAIGHSFGDPPTFVQPFLWSYGGSETDESGKKLAVNSAATKDALVAFKDLFSKAADPQVLSWDDSANNRSYAAKQIWATLNGASIYLTAVKDAPDLAKDTKLALLPSGPKGQFLLAVPFQYAVPKYVKDPGPARELISYIMAPKNYGSFMKAGKGYTLAPYKKGEGDLWPSTDATFDPFRKIGTLTKWYGYPAPPSTAAAESGSKYILVDMFAKVAQGDTPESAMSWAEGELKRVYKL
ncbi:MAG: extracellular solute-binding protein [Chloroflexi bacterium]|nr:MAG: extracellular solute-binding protein [Chloroflexota bacterium]